MPPEGIVAELSVFCRISPFCSQIDPDSPDEGRRYSVLDPLLCSAPSPVVLLPLSVQPLCIVTVTVLVMYSVCVAAVIAPYRLNPPPVTTIRESAPRLMLPRHVVAPLVVLRSAPFPAFVPVP